MKRQLGTAMFTVCTVVSLAACSGDSSDTAVESDVAHLSFADDMLWKPGAPAIEFTGIKLCFPGSHATAPEYATFRRAVQDAARAWSNASDNYVRFGTIDKCGSGIQILSESMDDTKGGSTEVGPTSEPIHINRSIIADYALVKSVALHELGHKLGFTHEQSHPDSTCSLRQTSSFLWWTWESGTTGKSPFPYDPNSVMNYCQPQGIDLSPGDIDGVQRLYGGNEYFLSDGRTFWLRSDHGKFLTGRFTFQQGLAADSLFRITNVGHKGQDVQFGHQVAIQSSTGSYLGAAASTNARTGAVTYALTSSSTPFQWDVSGFHAGGVNINKPIAFSALLSSQRVFLTSSLNVKNGDMTLGVTKRSDLAPPQDSGFIWRALGPGPETPQVCEANETRCGSACCGSGVICQDASISLCCGMFNERCGDTCCDLSETCVSGKCQVQVVTPPPPSTNCGVFPACSTIADCPSGYTTCSGCCGHLH